MKQQTRDHRDSSRRRGGGALPRAGVSLALVLGLVLGAAAVTPAAAQDDGTTLAGVTEEVELFREQVSNLEERYLKPELLQARYKLEARYNDAKVNYFLKDYESTALQLVDVIARSKPSTFASWREAHYLLGDSLFELRNFLAAKKYLQVVVDAGPGDHYAESIQRLLDIADVLGDYEGVDAYYAKLEAQSGDKGKAALQYARAKSLYRQKRYGDAAAAFERAARSKPFNFTGTYFAGVSLVAQEKFAEAMKRFGEVTQMKASNSTERYLKELAYLSLGRLAYESGSFDQAIDYYQRVPRANKHFDRALYELTWTLVQKERYAAALRNVEILLSLIDPDPRLEANARLLQADLASRSKEYGQAVENYEVVIDKYAPLRQQMRQVAAAQQDLQAFFQEVAIDTLAAPEESGLPELVQEWFSDSATHWLANSPAMSKARFAVSDMSEVEEDIEDTLHLLDQMDARLTSGARVKTFPKMHAGMLLAVEMENQALDIRNRLLQLEAQELQGAMTPEEKATWELLQTDFEVLSRKYAKVPRTAEKMEQREANVSGAYDELQASLDRVGYDIAGIRAQLKAIEVFREEGDRPPLSKADREAVDRMVLELKSDLVEYEKIREDLRKEVALAGQQTGGDDTVRQLEGDLRDQMRRQIKKQQNFLATIRGRGGDAGKLQRIAQLREQLPPMERELVSFHQKMNKLLDIKVVDLQTTIGAERELLQARADELVRMRESSRQVTGEVVHDYFVRSYEQIDDIVLRADVGRTDVLFQRKEDQSQEIDQLFEDRTNELNLLEKTFQQVR